VELGIFIVVNTTMKPRLRGTRHPTRFVVKNADVTFSVNMPLRAGTQTVLHLIGGMIPMSVLRKAIAAAPNQLNINNGNALYGDTK
jgi:hypothetical protein